MRKKIAKFSLLIMLLFVFVFLGGCSSEYNLTLKKNGVVEANIKIDLTGLEEDKIEKIYNVIVEYSKQLDNEFEKNILELYSKVFDYEKIKEKYTLDSDKKLIGYIFEYNDFVVNDSKIDRVGQKIYYTKSFASIYSQDVERTLTAYYLYFYPSALEYNEIEKDIILKESYKSLMDDIPMFSTLNKESDFFTTKIIQMSNPFYYNGEEPKFLEDYDSALKGSTIKEYLLSVTNLTEPQIELIFNFTTPYSRVHSNGTIKQTASGYTHSWKTGDIYSSVEFYRISARPIMWYAVAIGFSLIILILGLIIAVIIKNIKKKIGLKALKGIDNLANKK